MVSPKRPAPTKRPGKPKNATTHPGPAGKVTSPAAKRLDQPIQVLDNSSRAESLRIREAQLECIAAISGLVQTGTSIADLMQAVVRGVVDAMQIDFSAIVELVRENQQVRVQYQAGAGLPGNTVDNFNTVAPDSSIYNALLTQGKPLVVGDWSDPAAPSFSNPLSHLGIRSSIYTVIECEGTVWGVLEAHSISVCDFQPADTGFLQALAIGLGTMIRRRQVESSAEHSARLYEDVYNSAPCGFHSVDRDMVFVEVNDTELAWLGYTREELVGKIKLSDLIVRADWAPLQRDWRLLLEKGQVTDLEYEFLRKDGTTMTALLSSKIIADEQGKFVRTQSTLFDITERKTTERFHQIQFEVTRTIAESTDFSEAARKILQAIAEPLGWEYGDLWTFDRAASRFDLRAAWYVPSLESSSFIESESRLSLGSHTRMGELFNFKGIFWTQNLAETEDTPRRNSLLAVGLNSVVGFPIRVHGDVVAVIMFFSKTIEQPSKRLSNLLDTIGTQVGLFLEQIQSNEALRESQTLFRTMFDLNPFPTFITNLETLRYIDVNSTAIERYGYTREEFLQMSHLDIRPPEDRPKMLEFVDFLRADTPARFHSDQIWRHQLKNGEIIEIDSYIHKLRQRDRTVAVSIARDVTEELRSERALRESEALYRGLFNQIDDTIVIHDMAGRLLDVNDAACRRLGYSRDELLSMRTMDIDESGFGGDFANRLDAQLRTGNLNGVQGTHITRDGRQIAVDINSTVISYKGQPAVMAVVRDTTERKQIEAALRESEERYRTLFTTMAEGILFVEGAECTITDANPAVETILGYPVHSLIGRDFVTVGWTVFREDGVPFTVDEYPMVVTMRTGEPQTGVIVGFQHPAGDMHWVSVSARSAFMQGQLPGAVVVSLVDITERKWIQDELASTLSLQYTIFESSLSGILVLNTLGELVTYNRRFVEMFDISPSILIDMNLEKLGEATLDLIKNVDELVEKRKFLDVQPDATSLDLLYMKDGRIFERYSRPQRMGDEIVGRVWDYRDVTERKVAEQALAQERNLLQTIINLLPDYVYVKDTMSRFMMVNQAVLKSLHLTSANELIGKTDFDLFPQASAEEFYNEEQNLFKTGTPILGKLQYDGSNLSNGAKFWTLNSKVPLRDDQGKIIGLVGINHDISELIRIEDALRTSEAAEREQRLLAEALRETASLLASSLDLGQVLDMILNTLERVFPHDTASIILIEDEKPVIERFTGFDASQAQYLNAAQWSVAEFATFRTMSETKKPLIIRYIKEFPGWVQTPVSHGMQSYLGAPILHDGEVTGFLNLSSQTVGFFTQKHADTLVAFANQVAIAIQNARLYQQVRDLAASEERQRLARDLHDAVSQTLFSASIIAESLPLLWENDPEEVRRTLPELHRLTRGAQAEMRTLLLELRPSALLSTDMATLLAHLADALRGKSDVDIQLAVECLKPLVPDTQIAFYRIAQESLANIRKHGRASRVEINFKCTGTEAILTVLDNGRGFDIARVSGNHFGLKIMRERAESIGATFRISSQIGHGTEIVVQWHSPNPGVN